VRHDETVNYDKASPLQCETANRFERLESRRPRQHQQAWNGLSVGGPGASFNIGRKGTRTTLGLPGTGLSYVEQEPWNKPGTPIARSPWRWLFWVVLIGGMVVWAIAAHAQQTTVTCSVWQGVRTCIGPNGYRSTESEWQGVTTGQDNRGSRWSTTTWQGRETTIIRRNGQ